MTHSILIVEDNSDLSDLLSLYLRSVGYNISQAGSSVQGISKALAEQPDLILTDLHLADTDAVETITTLKTNPVTSGIPIVVLTATTFGTWRSKALDAGAAEYLTKPISPPELAETLRRVIDMNRLRSHITEL